MAAYELTNILKQGYLEKKRKGTTTDRLLTVSLSFVPLFDLFTNFLFLLCFFVRPQLLWTRVAEEMVHPEQFDILLLWE